MPTWLWMNYSSKLESQSLTSRKGEGRRLKMTKVEVGVEKGQKGEKGFSKRLTLLEFDLMTSYYVCPLIKDVESTTCRTAIDRTVQRKREPSVSEEFGRG